MSWPSMAPPADAKPAEPIPAPKPMAYFSGDHARVVVNLPADAKLFVDDQLMKASSEHRTFNTPALEEGQVYYYELRAEVMRNGQKTVQNKRLTLRSGEIFEASFTDLGSGVTTPAVVALKP
jgi:uncharacterized protein (TIGR03000 family)